MVGYAVSGTAALPAAVQGLINVRFPSGRLSSRYGRVLEIALITGIVLAMVAGVFSDQKLTLIRPDSTVEQLPNPLTDGTAVGRIAADLGAVVPVVVLLGLLAGLRVVRRAWKASGIERYQLRWRAYGVVFSLILFPFAVSEVLPAAAIIDLLDGLLFVTTLVIPVVRYRLWANRHGDPPVRRLRAGDDRGDRHVRGDRRGRHRGASQRTGFILAAAVAAVTFAPARGYSQRLVDHFFYGQRNDPYRALSDLGRRLTAVAAPGEVLPAVVTAVAQSLRLPYVAIERPADGSVLAAYGEPAAGDDARAAICWTPGSGWSARGRKNAAGCAAICTTASARC